MEPSRRRCGGYTKGCCLKAMRSRPTGLFLSQPEGSLQQAGLLAHLHVSCWFPDTLARGSPWAGLASSQQSVLGARRIRSSANSSRTFVRLGEPSGEPEGVLVSRTPGEAGGSVGMRDVIVASSRGRPLTALKFSACFHVYKGLSVLTEFW